MVLNAKAVPTEFFLDLAAKEILTQKEINIHRCMCSTRISVQVMYNISFRVDYLFCVFDFCTFEIKHLSTISSCISKNQMYR